MRTLGYVLAIVPVTVFYAMVCIVARLVRVPYRAGGIYDWAQQNFGRTLLAVAGVPVSVAGGEAIVPGSPAIMASNHQSFFDILAYLAWLPVHPKFIAKKGLFSIPIFGPALHAAGHVPIDRQNLREAMGAYDTAAARIREHGLHILVYPEGTRTRTGELLPFKKGPFVLAIASGAPIIPLYVDGAFDIMPKGSIRVRRRPVRILVGEPIPTAGLTYEDRDALAARTREAILGLRERLAAR